MQPEPNIGKQSELKIEIDIFVADLTSPERDGKFTIFTSQSAHFAGKQMFLVSVAMILNQISVPN